MMKSARAMTAGGRPRRSSWVIWRSPFVRPCRSMMSDDRPAAPGRFQDDRGLAGAVRDACAHINQFGGERNGLAVNPITLVIESPVG